MLFEFECPKCHGSLCEIHGEGCSDPLISDAHKNWRTGPLFAISELMLGQRMPIQILICKSCPETLGARAYVHCPECDTFHSASIFDPFGNWHGLICPDCGGSIPCIQNTTAKAIQVIRNQLPNSARIEQRNRYIETKKISANNKRLLWLENQDKVQKPNYLLAGLAFGGMIFIVSALSIAAFAYIDHWSLTIVLWVQGSSLLLAMAGGVLFGCSLKEKMEQKGDPELHLNVSEMIESHDDALIPEQSKDSKTDVNPN
jgi:hypothetical protein